jgi:translation initiation factor IF-1
MESLKLSLLQGDEVVIEIPALALSPTEVVRGRVIWRHKTQITPRGN